LCGEPADRVDNRKPGASRALGVVLMRLGIAEINQHAVAHILGDKPTKAADGLGDAAMVGADDLAQILGIEAHRQGCPTDQIAKHHGQLPSLCLRPGPHPSLPRMRGREGANAGERTGWNWIWGRVGGVELGNGFEQHTPVAYRGHADVLQIIGRQLGQHYPISLKTQASQPRRNVHQPPFFYPGFAHSRPESPKAR